MKIWKLCRQHQIASITVLTVFLAICISIYSFYCYSFLYFDGARIFNWIFNHGTYAAEKATDHSGPIYFLRFYNLLLQTPLYIYSNISEFKDTQLAYFFYSVPYHLQHIGSLLICFFLTQRKGKLELMLFPLASHLLVLVPASFFMQSFSQDVHAVFWPVMFYFTLNEKPNIVLSTVLIAILSFTYESSSLLLFLLGIHVFFFSQEKPKKILAGILILASLLITLYVAIHPVLTSTANRSMLLGYWQDNYLMAFFESVLIYGSLVVASTFLNKNKFIILVIGLVALDFFRLGQVVYNDLYEYHTVAFQFRVLVVPCMALFFVAYSLLHTKPFCFEKFKANLNILWFALLLFTIPSLQALVRTASYHHKGISNFSATLKNRPGCIYIPASEFHEKFQKYGVVSSTTYHYSLSLAEERELKSVILTDVLNWETNQFEHRDHCANGKKISEEFVLLENVFGRKLAINVKDYPKLKVVE